MKKKITIALAITLILSVGLLFADNPAPASFDVTTNVAGINRLKITTAAFSGNPSQFDAADAFTSLVIESAGAQTFSAYLSTLSNNRQGYTVSMGATAMTSEVSGQATSYINYTVSANGSSVATNGATAVPAVTVIDQGPLAGLSSQSHQIALSVDQESFDAAVQGSYTGTVTFEYAAK